MKTACLFLPEIGAITTLVASDAMAPLSYSVETSPSPRGQTGRFVPTLYGVAHLGTPREWQELLSVVKEARRNGARTVGLELMQETWRDPSLTNFFKELGECAVSLGMRLVFLEDPELHTRTGWLEGLKLLVSPEGGFDPHHILLFLVRAQEPERRGLFEKQAYLSRIGYDFDRYAADWEDVVVRRRTSFMRREIERRRPDLVFSGLAHVRLMTDLPRYRVVNLTHFEKKPLLEILHRERLPRLVQVAEEYPPTMLEWLVDTLGRILGIFEGGSETAKARREVLFLAERACALDQDFVPLFLRSLYEIDDFAVSNLVPSRHAAFFKMSIREAQERVRDVLQQASV